ncbi:MULTISPECIES: nuclear transport factor 2 family protein [unclassified Kitasatospora]|uniref:nuclear transport factor 2 family protein n=1 Tax=unclassified Kitasatospora TaxID=2633591 RepID=UPI001ADFA821|nr:nuclear transport factor 2 family protein [Kitasatospora sp. RG8]MBP0450521.1 nuclear transport factor 2 family protein [Kitasatospora sp. RG8]
MDSTVADLMRRNLLDVFNEPDPDRRATAIAETYAEGVVWHEPDRVIRGREALAHRAAELRAQTPDWTFQPDGPVSVNDDLGHLGFRYGPAGQAPVVTGMDIAHCKDGVIVELYTFVTEVHQPS